MNLKCLENVFENSIPKAGFQPYFFLILNFNTLFFKNPQKCCAVSF